MNPLKGIELLKTIHNEVQTLMTAYLFYYAVKYLITEKENPLSYEKSLAKTLFASGWNLDISKARLPFLNN